MAKGFEANLDTVEKVQEDQLAIARFLIREHGLQDVYIMNMDKLARLIGGSLDDPANSAVAKLR